MPNSDLLAKVTKYENSECRVKADLYLELMERDGGHFHFSKKEMDTYNGLRNCGESYWRYGKDGFCKQYIIKCNEPLCHKCNDYERFVLGEKVVEKIKRLFPDGKINRSSISWLTIDLDKLLLGSDLKSVTDEFKSVINDLLKRHLPNVAMLGHFHVASQKTDCLGEPNAMPHYHALVVHKENSMHEVETFLKDKFPLSNAVWIEPLYEDQDVDYSIHLLAAYAYNITFKYEGYGHKTGEVLTNYLKSVESLRKGGRNGLRFEPSYRRVLNQFKKDKEAASTRLMLRLNRIRLNNSNNLLSNEFPKDSCIHGGLADTLHLGSVSTPGNQSFTRLKEPPKFLQILHLIIERAKADVRKIVEMIISPIVHLGVDFHKRE